MFTFQPCLALKNNQRNPTPINRRSILFCKNRQYHKKIRLHGVNVPESIKHLTLNYINEHLINEEVIIDIKGIDKKDLIYADMKFSWGDTLSECLLRLGLGKWDQKNAPNIKSYNYSEKEARDSGLGVWIKKNNNTTYFDISKTNNNQLNNKQPQLPPDEQFENEIAKAAYQHSLAEREMIRSQQFGGRTDRFNASKSLALSLQYDIDAVNNRLKSGKMSISIFNTFQSEIIRLKTEMNKQLNIAVIDDFDYASAVSKYNTAIAMSNSGRNSDKEASDADKIFNKISKHNSEAIMAIRDAESRLNNLLKRLASH